MAPSSARPRRSRPSWPRASRSTASIPASESSPACAFPPADLAALQRNIVLSHAAGAGPPMPRPVARLMMALKLASLAQGASGVRLETVHLLEAMLAKGLTPVVPCQGSVGASGDLAPLAHMSAAMIGIGEIIVGDSDRARRAGARRGRPAPLDARRQGRPGAAQRHAVLDGLCARPACSRPSGCSLGAGHRRAVDRRRARLRRAVRSAHPSPAPPSRPDRDGRGACAS